MKVKLFDFQLLTRQGDGRTWPIWATLSIVPDALLNDVHLFVPYFDEAAVKVVVDDLRNVEDVPPSETGSARELVILTRRPGLDAVFEAIGALVTSRVNAARAQSHLRRYHALARG